MTTQTNASEKKPGAGAGRACIAFAFADPVEAYQHMNLELVEDYGKRAYGHYLYVWDDGERCLCRCRNCGGYVLVQDSEFHSFTDDGDSCYSDYFPVASPAEADELNRRFDGWDIERKFDGKYLMYTNGRLCWSRA